MFQLSTFSNSKIAKLAFFVSIIFLSLISFNANATHSAGADLQYTWISGNTFRVTVSFYRDCAGVAAPTSITLNAKSTSCSKNQNYTLALDTSSGKEITFPCRSVITKCVSSTSTYSGYQLYRYTSNVTLPSKCNDWVMSFYVCCRNCAITTLNSPCSANMYIEATLNNLAAPTNSSPQFTNIPVTFICVNQSFTFNHGVYDPDGDSLVYSFITPKTYNTSSNTVGTVTFNPGYSAANPVTSSPAISLNSSNGDIVMTPTVNNEIGVTAILVREYRNGVLIGSVMRDMQFLTRPCNPNFLPTVSGINGTSNYTATVCPGSTLTFTVNSADANATDSLVVSWNNSIPGATFTTAGTQYPVGTFTWTPSAADARNQPYSFVLTARDNACPYAGSQSYSFSIYVPKITASVSSTFFNGYNIACRNGATASATATPGGGFAPYSYSWSPSGQTTQTATGLGANTYTVTVSDASGCTSSASINLIQPPLGLSSTTVVDSNVSCFGGANGSATINASGGIAPYTYLWTPSGQTTFNATGLSANSYTVIATDQNGCTSTQTVVITQPAAALSAVVSQFDNVTCKNNNNGSITITASNGTGPYTHAWSNGATTAAITNLAPGNYSDTIRDFNNCQFIISQTITEPPVALGIPTSSLSTTNVSCFGGSNGTASVNPVGGTGPYVINWSNGDSGNTADSLFAGTYLVHLVDVNNCSFDTNIVITAPSVLNPSLFNYPLAPGGTDVACFGDTTGKIKVLSSGGTAPYTYLWSSSATTDSIRNLPAGIYSVVVTDNKGCSKTLSDTITQPAVLANPWTIRNVGCKGESSGFILTHLNGGANVYSYAWTPNISNNDSAYLIPAGFYQVDVTDINGCMRRDTITITEPDSLVPLISPATYIGAVNLKCYGDSSGSATVNVFGGTPPFTYLWNNGASAVTINNLTADRITVRVVDANGCSIEKDTTLNQPTPFSYANNPTNPRCYGDTTGFIKLNVSGSTPAYSYNWSTGNSTDSIGQLVSGFYYCLIEDQNNCKDSLAFTLTNPDSITTSANVSDYLGYNISCNGGNNGYIQVFATGGDSTFTYAWSNAATADSIYSLIAATYGLTITDGRGCRKDTTISLNEPMALSLTLLPDTFVGGTNVRCFGYNDGAAHSSVSGGTSPYQYQWSNGDIADSTVGLTAGNYLLTVTDSNNCVVMDSITIAQPGPVNLAAVIPMYNGYNIPCFGDTNTCITLNMTGGNNPFTFVWDGVDTITAPTRCNLGADTFNIVVVDGNGCQLDTFFILTGPAPISFITNLSAFGIYNINCNGQTNGAIDVTMNGGVAPFAYQWSNTATTEDISTLSAGFYQLNVTDNNGCLDSVSYTLTEPPILTATLASTNATCSVNNGTATATPSGGVSPYTYLWSNTQITNPAVGLVPQNYSVVITDSIGCTYNDTITVDGVPLAAIAVSSSSNNRCYGFSEGSATVSLTNGTAPFTYAWSNGDVTSTADSLAVGSYSLVVTDSNNCVSNATVVITEPAPFAFTYSVTNAFCNGLNNGTATVSTSGGTGSYLFNWSNGDQGNYADSLAGGYALVQVTDSFNCTQTDSVQIIQGSTIVSSIASSTNVSCFGGNNGTASVQPASGGIGPLSYLWSNNDQGLVADTLTVGNYSVNISDSANCSVAINITITQPQLLAANISSTNVTCNALDNGVVSTNVTGGVAGYSFVWTPSGSGTSISNLSPGTYSVLVTDQNNCTTSASATITQPQAIVANAGGDVGNCIEVFALNANLLVGYSGQWSVASGTATFNNINSPSPTVVGLTLGNNMLVWTITDGTCFGSDTIVVRRKTDDECILELPSAYSPNDDGSNDAYVIHGIERYPNNILSVFNRWGNLVYQKENYANEWVGNNNSGEQLPEGTYFLILEIRNTDIKLNTYVDVRR